MQMVTARISTMAECEAGKGGSSSREGYSEAEEGTGREKDVSIAGTLGTSKPWSMRRPPEREVCESALACAA